MMIIRGRGGGTKSPKSELKQDDLSGIITPHDEYNESLNHTKPNNGDSPNKKKCPYCDYEEHPFYLKTHIRYEHGIGKEPEIRDTKEEQDH